MTFMAELVAFYEKVQSLGIPTSFIDDVRYRSGKTRSDRLSGLNYRVIFLKGKK